MLLVLGYDAMIVVLINQLSEHLTIIYLKMKHSQNRNILFVGFDSKPIHMMINELQMSEGVHWSVLR